MKLFFGLGNPDLKYQNTRHNLGSNVILNVAKDLHLIFKSHAKLSAKIAQSSHLYAYAATYMNESGLAVQKTLNFYKIPPSDLFLIHDDLDLEVGEWKLQFDRGSAGHKGVESVVKNLGTQAFWRLRIGIGKPTDSTPVENYVLLPFTPEEQVIIDQTIDKIVKEISQLSGR